LKGFKTAMKDNEKESESESESEDEPTEVVAEKAESKS
jgi:Sec-independent protein translocase protein TatA